MPANALSTTPMRLLDGRGVAAALDRMADDLARGSAGHRLAVLGVLARGDVLAQRLVDRLTARGLAVDHGAVDIALFRDDLQRPSGQLAVVRPTQVPFDITGRHVALVDDVLHTGRTARAAIDAVMNLGRPATLRLAVLVDRGGHELPLRADVVGLSIDSPHRKVRLTLTDAPPEGESVMLDPFEG